MARVQLHYNGIGDVMRSTQVRSALRAQSETIAARARSISASEHVTSTIGTEHGTRPQGRPYSRATSDAAAAEYGSATTPRRRVLWRAATGGY